MICSHGVSLKMLFLVIYNLSLCWVCCKISLNKPYLFEACITWYILIITGLFTCFNLFLQIIVYYLESKQKQQIMTDKDNDIMTDKTLDDQKEVQLIVHVQPPCFSVYDKENNNHLHNKDVETKRKDGESVRAKRARSRSSSTEDNPGRSQDDIQNSSLTTPGLERVLSMIRSQEVEEHQCCLCGSVFPNDQVVLRHRRLPHPHKCDECPRRFVICQPPGATPPLYASGRSCNLRHRGHQSVPVSRSWSEISKSGR